jgi:hypothetical protein
MTHPTPDQVLEQRRRLLLDQDTEGFVALFAPDGAIELPFAGPEMPTRLDGQQAIRDFTASLPFRIGELITDREVGPGRPGHVRFVWLRLVTGLGGRGDWSR